ncbi:MAG: CHAP domain-containing protein [Pseudomonadota bacterium]
MGVVVVWAAAGCAAGSSTRAFAGPDGVSIQHQEADLQCVPFARAQSGVDLRGDAGRWWALAADRYARGRTPAPGAVLVLAGKRDPSRGHVAVVRAVRDDGRSVGELRIDHANWLNRGDVARGVPVRDASADGDWSRVNVWHAPTGTWGLHDYRVVGFIYPEPPGWRPPPLYAARIRAPRVKPTAPGALYAVASSSSSP